MNYFDFDTEISVFSSLSGKKEASTITVNAALESIKGCDFQEEVNKITDEDDSAKRDLIPAVAFHGVFEGQRLKKNFVEATGLVIVDIDNVEKGQLEAHKSTIMSSLDSCVACFISPSKNGLKCLYLVDREMVNADTYRKIGRSVAKKFEKYGDIDVLSVTDCLILSCDENIAINYEAIPDLYVKVEEVKKEVKNATLGKKEGKYELYDDAEDFFFEVLHSEVLNRADNNYHFIQMAVFELAKFGFKSPDFDLSFIVDEAECNFKVSKENGKRLEESIQKAYDIEQVRYPYNYGIIKEGELGSDSGGDFDYSDYEEEASEEEEVEYTVVSYDDLYEQVLSVMREGDRVGAEVSFGNLADIFRFKKGLTVITGSPTSGKTEMTDAILVDLARLHGWDHGIAGFEQSVPEHINKLIRKCVGFDVTSPNADKSEHRNAFDFIASKFRFLDTNVTGGNLKRILKDFDAMVEKHGTKSFVIDPFNHLTITSKSSDHTLVNEILRMLVQFCNKHEASLILIAHPTKLRKNEKTGKYDIPTFYDVKGSSAFYEMAHHGLVVHRDDDNVTPVLVKVLKVKQNNLGVRDGEAYFRYIKGSGRYVPMTKSGVDIGGDYNEKNWHLNLQYLN